MQESMSRCIQKSIYTYISKYFPFWLPFSKINFITYSTYSTYRNTMIASVNCLILGEDSRNNFNVVVGEIYTSDDKIDVAFDQFTVSNFKELLFRRKKVKRAVQDPDSMNLYKVELSLSRLKDKIYILD